MAAELIGIHDPSGIRDGGSVRDETGESIFFSPLSSHVSPALCIFAHKAVQICLRDVLFLDLYRFSNIQKAYLVEGWKM